MAYSKSYYEQRVEEQARIREAVQKQIQSQQEEPTAPPVDEAAPVVDLPTAGWTKADIQAWLTANGIAWATSMTKTQLLELVPE